MLYHTLRKMANHLGPAAALVRSAAIFHLDIAPHESLPKFSSEPKLAWLRRNFRLPYRITGIEDRASCVVLAEATPVAGLDAERMFIECLPADLEGTDASAYSDSPEEARQVEDALRGRPAGSVMISLGTVSAPSLSHEGSLVAGQVDRVLCGTPDRLLWARDDLDPEDPLDAPMIQAALRNGMTAIEEIAYVQELPGFVGWPQGAQVRDKIYEIDADGQIRPSSRLGRVA